MFKPDVSPDENPIRLQQHGTSFFFFTNMLHKVQHVCEKYGIFRPAGGKIRFRVSDRVTPVH